MNKNKYEYRFKLWGYATVEVEAEDPEEAEELVNDIVCSVDCGELENIESEMVRRLY